MVNNPNLDQREVDELIRALKKDELPTVLEWGNGDQEEDDFAKSLESNVSPDMDFTWHEEDTRAEDEEEDEYQVAGNPYQEKDDSTDFYNTDSNPEDLYAGEVKDIGGYESRTRDQEDIGRS